MNCNPGDLALVVRGDNAGKMITCVRLCDPPGVRVGGQVRGRIWFIDRELPWTSEGGTHRLMAYCPDEYLLPINPQRRPSPLTATSARGGP